MRRRAVRRMVGQHPIPAFVVLAFASSWSLIVLMPVSVLFGLVALFGPAFAAVVVSWADGTTAELRDRIVGRRTSPRSLIAAIGIPFGVAAGALAVYVLSVRTAPGVGSVSTIEILLFVLVIGEETGWRGFLMPRLRARMSLPLAGALTGVIWTLWHLPIYLAPTQGLAAFAVFAWWVVPFAIAMGFVAESARYSILVATVMHGAANVALPLLLPGVDLRWAMLTTGAFYWVIAIALIAWSFSQDAHAGVRLINKKEVAA